MSQRDLGRRILELKQEFDDQELEDALLIFVSHSDCDAGELLLRLVAQLPLREPDLLDAAASLAARHQSLQGDESQLRSWLTLLTLRSNLARQIGGEPHRVLHETGLNVMTQAKASGEAIQTIWREPMLESRDAAVALGAKPTNREKVRQYRERSWLLGLPSGRGFVYPAFQFDPERRDAFPEVRAVNERLSASSDPWGVASWWISRHARLSARPVDLVGTGRADDLVTVAEAVVEPVG